jgi:peptide-methionine (R)-S-oxide reductase
MLRVARIGARNSAALVWLAVAAVIVLLFIARAAGAAPKLSPGASDGKKPAARAPHSPPSDDRAERSQAEGSDEELGDEESVHKTDAEWKRILTRKQYRVARRGETETPFSGKYWKTKLHGAYHCVCCGAKLFSSEAKFNSGTGWPSFWAPVDDKRLSGRADYSDGGLRIEVLCSRCDAHLGHVFDDGPPPTGLRYCINSASLEFEERDRSGDAEPPAIGD